MSGVRVQLIPMDEMEGVTLPSVSPREYVVVDHDDKVCRVVDETEFDATYVDRNIATFKLRGVNWLTLDVDENVVDIVYDDGRRASVLLGSIDLSAPVRTQQYGKSGSVINPIDESGAMRLNATDTPNLAAMRRWYHREATRVNDERIEIAEVVHSFAQIINVLGSGHDTVTRPQ
jgi:hypothetical protein